AQRAKLYDLLAERADSGLVILSGDRHAGGIYKTEHKGETIWELTSSSLNLAFGNDNDRSTAREPDASRVTRFFSVENYGLVDIDWKAKRLTMTLKGNDSGTLAEQAFNW
ncbi:MAG: alkaline phosphatase PhoD, partial [Porphyrobacter sp. HL-46]